MRLKYLITALLLFFIFPNISSAWIRIPSSNLSGIIIDEDINQPVVNANVSYSLSDNIYPEISDSTITDNNGYYSFYIVGFTAFLDIKVEADGYKSKIISRVDVPLWDDITVNIELENKLDPIIIIPGIMGSWYSSGEWKLDPILHTYDDLYNSLVLAGYRPNIDLFTFPYDWGMSNATNAIKLKNKIQAVKNTSSSSKVDIIAHSMGGLITRQYIESDSYNNDIDQLIFLGTPQSGSTDSYLTWSGEVFYDESKIISLLKKRIFSLIAHSKGYSNLFDFIHEKIISVKELLPIYDYLKDNDTGILREYPNNYPVNDFLDDLNKPENLNKLFNSGVEITNFVSDSNNTLSTIFVADSHDEKLWQNGEPKNYEYTSGDGTVPYYSSSFPSNVREIKIDADHRHLPEMARKEVIKILLSDDKPLFVWSLDEIEDWNSTMIADDYMIIGVHSPVDILITDPSGQQIGADSDLNNLISQAFYSGKDDPEFVVIPSPIAGDYNIALQGTGDGEYTISVDYVNDNQDVNKSYVGLIKSGQQQNIDFSYSIDSTIDEIVKEVNIDDVIQDIEMVYDSGWLEKNSHMKKLIGYLEKLKKQLEIIEKEIRIINIMIDKIEISQDPALKFKQKMIDNLNKKIDQIEQKKNRVIKKEIDASIDKLNKIKKQKEINDQGYNLLLKDYQYLMIDLNNN